MWPTKVLQGINDRLDHLESAQNLDDISATLGSARDEIVALRATLDHHGNQLDLFEPWRQELTLAVAEGIERVDRAERRIKATVARARKELANGGLRDEGLDAEAYELRELHGNGSEQLPLPAVQQEVAAVEPQPSSIGGVPLDVLLRARGMLR